MTLEEGIEASISETIDTSGLRFVGGTSIGKAVRAWAKENALSVRVYHGELEDGTGFTISANAVPLDKFGDDDE